MPVVGFEGKYEVSNCGRVWSVPRRRRRVGRYLRQSLTGKGYWGVKLYTGDGRSRTYQVHRLMAEAFLGPPGVGQQVRHLNGIRTNNVLPNLAWGSSSENALDAVMHGQNHQTNKTHCPSGHEYTPENIRWYKGWRRCRACHALHRAL